MSTTLPATVQLQRISRHLQAAVRRQERRFAALLVTALTFLAVAVEGYHPFTEDGGLYVAGVEHLLDPGLFPRWREFVEAPTHLSLFAPAVAAVVRASHLSLPTVLLLLHLTTIWVTLFGAWLIAERCWTSREARTGAVLLLACWLALPIAGTSLQFMDPYVTARSFSTPCMVLSLVGVLWITQRNVSGAEEIRARKAGWILCSISLIVAFLMHPLMAGYALGASSILAALRGQTRAARLIGAASLCLSALALALAVHTSAPPETATYARVALTRSYWFPARWAWYETLGLAAPLAILAFATIGPRWLRLHSYITRSHAERALTGMAAICGTTSLLVALFFAHAHSSEHLVARLQPLRAFQIVYLIMVLLLGALLGEHILRWKPLRWLAATLLLSGIVFSAERAAYPDCTHIEFPGMAGQNPWVQAFLWVRTHTPKDALFALDPDYIHAPAEDGDCFRAIAQRSALPDYSKDGGEASIAPELASAWQAGQALQRPLATHLAVADLRALRSAGVSWIIVRAGTAIHSTCPYSNSELRICRLD